MSAPMLRGWHERVYASAARYVDGVMPSGAYAMIDYRYDYLMACIERRDTTPCARYVVYAG